MTLDPFCPVYGGTQKRAGSAPKQQGAAFCGGSEEFQRTAVVSVLKLLGEPQTWRAHSEAEALQRAGRGKAPKQCPIAAAERSKQQKNRGQRFAKEIDRENEARLPLSVPARANPWRQRAIGARTGQVTNGPCWNSPKAEPSQVMRVGRKYRKWTDLAQRSRRLTY
jgi:hypothetical protein